MKTSTLALFCLVLSVYAHCQCLTDFTKLLPDPASDYTLSYGSTFSLHENYLAVGLPAHDSLGRVTGLVYVYEKITAGWKKIATLIPSDPVDALRFGANVKVSSDYILVTAGLGDGKVYLYKKPATGWETQTELTTFSYPNTNYFGKSLSTGLTDPVAISDDQQTIAIADLWYEDLATSRLLGAVFVYHKQPHEEWNSSMVPVMIRTPEPDATDFGRAGVTIAGDRLITGTPHSPTGGKLYVYRDPSGEFTDLQLEAGLRAGDWPSTFWLGYYRFIYTEDGIFSAIATDPSGEVINKIVFFQKPASGNWADTNVMTCTFSAGDGIDSESLPVISTNGRDLIASYRASDGNGYTTLIKKGAGGWCDPVYENIDVFVPHDQQLTNQYGSIIAASQEHVAVGVLPLPESQSANLSLKVFSHNADDTWQSEFLYPRRKTTAGHSYGGAILGFEDFLFVGAPLDGTLKEAAGAVYIYRKSGGSWNKTGKILAPADERNDNVFGTAFATNGNELAVGATGFGDHGRVFIYRKKASDWSEVELSQEIELPEDILTVFSYGDNIAMNDEWLLIPYVQNSPARIMIAIYKHTGTQWEYSQVVETGLGSINSKFTTRAVAIDGSIVVAGNRILEQDADGIWRQKYLLSPSDPEHAQIASDFSHWIRNGDTFGHAIAISENSIFISAPTKDYGDIWDVGAIYVFTKKPWESWSSRTETAKILPRVKEEREMFGYSLKVLGNTLLAGAPGADINKDGTPRLKPGRAYVFQSEDYFWQDVKPLLDLTGDSFVKDYFGMSVALDETDFFIAAPVEDIPTGKLSGSVYITPAPPIVKLVPPVCSTATSIDLFGYPFGGTWSGPGLIDPAEGIFDPAISGTGEHTFIYRTVSCTYEGKLKIVVESPVEPVLAVAPEHFVCETATSFSIPLAVEPRTGHQYLWYHRETPTEPFFPLNAKQSTLTAQLRGEYKVKMSNTVCEAFSPVITIRNEEVELDLAPVDRICEDRSEGVLLSASPAGGTWTGPGTRDNHFYSSGVNNGTHTLVYAYRSPLACSYTDQLTVEVDRVPVPTIKRMAGNLCIDAEANLAMTSEMKANVAYTWQHQSEDGAAFTSLDSHDQSITVDQRGTYRLEAADGDCVVASKVVAVDDDRFQVDMKPDGDSLTTCDGAAQALSITPQGERMYQWYFAESNDDEGTAIHGADNYEILADVSGYYYAVVQSGKCEVQTPRKEVTIHAMDEISFPNVVTPNGDDRNEFFTVVTNAEVLNVRIMNRYGKTIFSGPRAESWDVQRVGPGIYFATVTYNTCEGELGMVKGFVQVMD